MKSVLISIQPKWCELIASGKKTVEVRKTKPKLETPFKVYIYCTKGIGDCLWRWNGIWYDTQFPNERPNRLDGKVIGEFVCDRIIDILYSQYFVDYYHSMPQADLEATCLDMGHIDEYLLSKDGYGWHISDLVIYDKPKELSEFWNADKCPYASKDGCTYKYHCFRAGQTKRCGDTLTRPPQSWCYVEGE